MNSIDARKMTLLGLGASDDCAEPWLGCPEPAGSGGSSSSGGGFGWDDVKDFLKIGGDIFSNIQSGSGAGGGSGGGSGSGPYGPPPPPKPESGNTLKYTLIGGGVIAAATTVYFLLKKPKKGK